jgi:hypothetical protein
LTKGGSEYPSNERDVVEMLFENDRIPWEEERGIYIEELFERGQDQTTAPSQATWNLKRELTLHERGSRYSQLNERFIGL